MTLVLHTLRTDLTYLSMIYTAVLHDSKRTPFNDIFNLKIGNIGVLAFSITYVKIELMIYTSKILMPTTSKL